MPAGSWSRRAHGHLQLCNESQRLQQTLHQAGISSHTDPESSSQGTSPPSNTSMDALPPPPSSHGALTALRLQDRGARWHGTGHGTCRRKQDGAGRPACTRMEGHRDFSILNRETGDCSPPKNAFPGQRQLIAELLRAEQRGETSAGVPGHSAFPLQMTRHFLIHEKD